MFIDKITAYDNRKFQSMIKNNVFSKFYYSSKLFGNDKIIRSFYKLDANIPIPLSIPHGIDFYQHENFVHDFYNFEPYYHCFRDDLETKVRLRNRKTIKLPHPWIMLLDRNKFKLKDQKGSLIVTGSPSIEKYEEIYNRIDIRNLPKPIFVLIKDRDARKEHFDWWKKKEIEPLSAGPIESNRFYLRLFNILNECSDVLIFDMTSAAIFAAAMMKKIHIVSDIFTTNIELDVVRVPKENSENYTKVKDIWTNLLLKDRNTSYATANFLLGKKFLNKENKHNFIEILNSNYKPLFLHPIKNQTVYSLLLFLIKKNNKIIKFFPFPLNKIITKIKSILKVDKVYFTRINSLAYYRIAGKFQKPKRYTFYQYQLEEYNPGRHVKIKKKYKHLYNF